MQRGEKGSVIKIETIRWEMDQEVDVIDDTNGEINPYHDVIVNKAERDDIILSQMEEWSILSNMINYLQYDRHSKKFYDLDIKL